MDWASKGKCICQKTSKRNDVEKETRPPIEQSYIIEFEGKIVHGSNYAGLKKKSTYALALKALKANVSEAAIRDGVLPVLMQHCLEVE